MAIALLAFAAIAMAAVSTAMSSPPMRAGLPPSNSGDSTPTPAARPSTPRATTIVLLLVASEAQAERTRLTRSRGGLAGSRGKFDVQVAVVRTAGEELLLRAMLLSDTICPLGTCGDVAIIDLRPPSGAADPSGRGSEGIRG